jgi:hypothetical protein
MDDSTSPNDVVGLLKKIMDSDATTEEKVVALKAMNHSAEELNRLLKDLNQTIKEEKK